MPRFVYLIPAVVLLGIDVRARRAGHHDAVDSASGPE
jgi:hypothetical protein